MNYKYDIRIGNGIGPLKLGMTMSEVTKLLGDPATKNVIYKDTTFNYFDEKLCLNFNENSESKLVGIDCSMDEIFFNENQLMGKSLEYVLEVFSDINDWRIDEYEVFYHEYRCLRQNFYMSFENNTFVGINHYINFEPKSIMVKMGAILKRLFSK